MKEKLTKCPICGVLYPQGEKECPACKYKKPLDADKAMWIIIILLLPFTIIKIMNQNMDFKLFNNSASNQEKIATSAEISLKIHPMSELSYLSKDEILSKRKEFVKESFVFSDLKNYEPSSDVYKIESGLPWIGAEEIAKNGTKGNQNIANGSSRHSTSINNPELLVSFIVPDFSKKRAENTFSEADFFFPQKLISDKNKKNIKAYFDIKTFYDKNPNFRATAMYPDETNARDMGYNWFYCDKSENIVFFKRSNSILQEPKKVSGFYHKGFSCGLESGCNNYSPYQEHLVFRVVQNEGYMRIRMWKNKPATKFQSPDMTYEMFFR